MKIHNNFKNDLYSACPLCHSTDFTLLNSNDRYLMGLRTVGCNSCGLLQTNPRPSVYALDKFYKESYRHFYQGIETPGDLYVKEQRKRERFKSVLAFLNESKVLDLSSRVLDVGCSEGTFFAILREYGCWQKFLGVEPNTKFADYASRVPNTMIKASMDELIGEFDLVTLIHVLEHHIDPLLTLRKMNKHLAPGGYLYVDVPDAAAYHDIGALHIAHLFHFTEKTLMSLLYRADFQIVVIESYSPINHPRSIRVLARRSTGDTLQPPVSTRETERLNWKIVAQLSVWRIVIKRYAKGVPGLAAVYRMIKKTMR